MSSGNEPASTPGAIIGIWGLGREGNSALKFLQGTGATFVVTDEADNVRPLELDPAVEYFSGPGALEALLKCTLVVVSPGVPRVHPFREHLKNAGVPTTSATNLWMAQHADVVVGVTGTKGKSTTSSLIQFLLEGAGVASDLGGNIGVPLTNISDPKPVVVAELSSYQCAYLERSPHIAVVTTLFQDHLTWHGSIEQYRRDKTRIFTEGAEVLVCSVQALEQLRLLKVNLPPVVRTEEDGRLSGFENLQLPESFTAPHMRANLGLAILATAEVTGNPIDLTQIAEHLMGFKTLAHRLDVVSERDGRLWVDDTLATTTESVIAAIASFPGREIILLLGGLSRGIDYTKLNTALIEHQPPVSIVALPENGLEMVSEFRARHPDMVHAVVNLDEAVVTARNISSPGTVILLSPGAPSQNIYKDFTAKSEHFASAIASLESI